MRTSQKLSITLSTALTLAGFDANPQALTLQLDAPTHNGYHVSCTGGKDGAIDLTISGGTPPYQVEWSTGASTEDVADLVAGYYRVGVTDGVSGFAEAELTLNEPDKITVELAPYEWPNGYNVSCFNCFNGSIAVATTGGVTPYTYLWRDGILTEDRSYLGSGNYGFELTDANGCTFGSELVYLTEPQSNDWKMSGNAGTNPAAQYIGTSDNKDVVFKSNGVERLRILSTGDIKAHGLGSSGFGLLGADANGILKRLTGDEDFGSYTEGCTGEKPYPWLLCGNNILPGHFLGTTNEQALLFKTFNEKRMAILSNGQVVLGPGNYSGANWPESGSKLVIKNGWSDWISLINDDGDPATDDGYWHLHNPGPERDRLLFYYTDESGDTPPNSGVSFWNDGKVSIGTTDRPGDYLLYVGTGILTEKVKIALTGTAQWSDHVFKPGYKLMPLKDVETFIAENGHLPGVPSAECLVEEGLDVVKTNAMLMEKVEELTLYQIEMNERLNRLEAENARLRLQGFSDKSD